jgi:hypothetical protein
MLRKINKIKKIKIKHEKSWLSIEGVVAVGIGNTSKGTLGIIISVRGNSGKYRGHIPESIENIPIDIKITGDLKAF